LILVERRDERARVTFNDPGKLNALSAQLTLRLHAELRALVDDPDVKTVVLTGTDPAFSAGGDLRLMRDVAHRLADDGPEGTAALWRWIRGQFGGVAKLIARSDVTFIAAVNGAAAGVGLAFAIACDLVLASERARIVPAFGRIGLLPEVGTSHLFTRRLGYHRAFELFTAGRHLTGAEAAELGLANSCHPHDELIPAAEEWCDRLAALPSHIPSMTKPLLRSAADMSWDHAITMEEFAEPGCFTTDAHREAVAELLASEG
jgi:2-(1,2-epoxy-1,2-dihydrophenyl)acetyl-CoA isomerase